MTAGELLFSRSGLGLDHTTIQHLESARVAIEAEAVSFSIDTGDSYELKSTYVEETPETDNLVLTEENNDIILSTETDLVLTTSEDITYE